MPLRHGASRSKSEAGGETPRMSMASLMASERQARLTIGQGGRSEQKSSTNEEGHVSLISEAPAPCWWAMVDSGMLSTSIFLLAMILYLLAIPPYNCARPATDLYAPPNFPSAPDQQYNYYTYHYYDTSPDYNSCVGPGYANNFHVSSWLFLVAAALFILEAGMDVMWGVKRILAQARLKSAQKLLGTAVTGRPSAASEDNEIPLTAFDMFPWDFWAAVLFVIASVFYLVSSLVDPYCVDPPWTWLIIGPGNGDQWQPTSVGIGHDTASGYAEPNKPINGYSVLVCKIAAVMFVVDSIVGLLGRYSYIRTTPPAERLVILQVWKLLGFFEFDWALWGDLFFFIGAVVGVVQQFQAYTEPLDWLVESLWTVDALFYCLACWPTMRAMMKVRVADS